MTQGTTGAAAICEFINRLARQGYSRSPSPARTPQILLTRVRHPHFLRFSSHITIRMKSLLSIVLLGTTASVLVRHKPWQSRRAHGPFRPCASWWRYEEWLHVLPRTSCIRRFHLRVLNAYQSHARAPKRNRGTRFCRLARSYRSAGRAGGRSNISRISEAEPMDAEPDAERAWSVRARDEHVWPDEQAEGAVLSEQPRGW
jgi:hypothetical protein